MAVKNNVGLLIRCIRNFPRVNFADRDTSRIYARFEAGQLQWTDPDALARARANMEVRAALDAAAPDILKGAPYLKSTPEFLQPDHFHTIGRWDPCLT
jgi:hypothetical protein